MLRIGIYTEPKALSECGGLTPLFDSRDQARRKKMSFKLRTACAPELPLCWAHHKGSSGIQAGKRDIIVILPARMPAGIRFSFRMEIHLLIRQAASAQ